MTVYEGSWNASLLWIASNAPAERGLLAERI